ncbi:ABC transporter substrate-binding protein [Paenibacillus massiliensis]|uniref:ABC transporter substrate-binding protein n=1 Tax=Paenibacillus massiliensis TaxID=225917 RepID=UPI00036BF8D9|nr:ABC transporter substrate-binding protein [Paenibacillus massiliensis]
MKKVMMLLMSVLLIGVLTACGATGSSDGSANTGQDSGKKEAANGELRKVTVQIDGAAVPYYAPMYVAKEQGFFEEQGLDVEFLYADAATIIRNVAANNVQFGFPNADTVVTAKSQDLPVKVVHTTYQHGLGATIFKKSSGISTPADLKDKTIAVTSYGSPNYIQLQVLLESHGLSIRDVNVKIVGSGAIVNALVADEVDAIIFSMLRTVELQNSGEDVAEFRSDEVLPSFGNVVVTSESYLASNKEDVIGFTTALDQALDYIIKDGNIESSIQMSVEKYAPTFAGKEEVVAKIFNDVFVPYLWQSELTKTEGYGAADMARWQTAIDSQQKFGIIAESFPAEELVLTNLK